LLIQIATTPNNIPTTAAQSDIVKALLHLAKRNMMACCPFSFVLAQREMELSIGELQSLGCGAKKGAPLISG
jgi:hypothetical protein